jgi:predicted NUDIX family NTP pyrophosphohydrolase
VPERGVSSGCGERSGRLASRGEEVFVARTRAGKARRLFIETTDGRRFWLRRERGGWICAPAGVVLDHNAVRPSARDAITLATGIGPESPWVREQERLAEAAGL